VVITAIGCGPQNTGRTGDLSRRSVQYDSTIRPMWIISMAKPAQARGTGRAFLRRTAILFFGATNFRHAPVAFALSLLTREE